MYEEIKHYLSNIFGTDSEKEFVESEYIKVRQLICEAKNLAQLFNARARLIEFNEMMKETGYPNESKNKVKFLEARWNKQYRLWKARG
jgi:hypothetical protein